ncbi:MAG: carboxypeptidase regulatory-like domain-containing protein [Nitrospiraceae bacterium]
MKHFTFAILCLLFNLEASAEAASGADLIGPVTLTGVPPSAAMASVSRDTEFCGSQVPIESLVVDPAGKGIRGAVAEVEGIAGVPVVNPDPTPIALSNRTCAFTPRIQASDMNHALEIRNEDGVMHNTHITHESRTFVNVALMPGTKPIVKRLKAPGIYQVRCDAHRFMEGYILVFGHSYFSVTDDAGTFRISGLPPGERTVTVWHETLGRLSKTVTIPPRGEVSVLFEFQYHENSPSH